MARTPMSKVKQKQVRALQLVTAGCSYDEIAQDLGYASRASAWRLVRSALDKQVVDCAAEFRHLEGERLDALQAAYWGDALAGDRAAAMIVLQVLRARARLYGLDRAPLQAAAADRTIYDLPDGYDLVITQPEKQHRAAQAGAATHGATVAEASAVVSGLDSAA